MEHTIFQFPNGKFLNLCKNTFDNRQFDYGFNVTDDPAKATHFDKEKVPALLSYLDGKLVKLQMEVLE